MQSGSYEKAIKYITENLDNFRYFKTKNPERIVNHMLQKSIGFSIERFVGLYIGITNGNLGKTSYKNESALQNQFMKVLEKKKVPHKNRQELTDLLVETLKTGTRIHDNVQDLAYELKLSNSRQVILGCYNTDFGLL
jgi:hypothetical protein